MQDNFLDIHEVIMFQQSIQLFCCSTNSKINIGPLFQADVPLKPEPQSDAIYDKHRAAVCWTPFEQETKKRTHESK